MIISGSSRPIQESAATLVTSMEERSSQPIVGENFLLAPVISGPSTATHALACYEQPTLQERFLPCKEAEVTKQDVLPTKNSSTFEAQGKITTDQKTDFSQQSDAGTFQQMLDPQGYLQPVESGSVTRTKTNLNDENLLMINCPANRLKFTDEIEMVQHRVKSRTFNQTPSIDPQTRPLHRDRSYQNDDPVAVGVSTYAYVSCNVNWEIPHDHLSLKKKIGGGSFGQVWKGKLYDVTGVGDRSVVAVKMLKGKTADNKCTQIITSKTRK